MRSSTVLLAATFVSTLVATEGIIIVTGVTAGAAALALGGLAVLKGAAILGLAAGRGRRRSHRHHHKHHYHHRPRYHHHYGKRSVEDLSAPVEESENVLLDAVSQLDPHGCVLKLLCKLQAKELTERTFEENILVDMFSNGTEVLTSYNAAFVYASEVGSLSHNSATCDESFPQCPLDELQLSSLLQKSWGCGSFLDEANENQNPQEVPQEGSVLMTSTPKE